jgi:phosphatidylserine decarboxylase
MTKFKNSLIYLALYLLPKNLTSCLMGYLVSLRLPRGFAIKVNKAFARMFRVDLLESEKPIEDYPCLQEFFIRKLKPGLRPIMDKDAIVSPCDGMLSVTGDINDGTLIQAKGKYYHLAELVGDQSLAKKFFNGSYATIYLSPKDYHRFHAPMRGSISKTVYIPGKLWPVNNWAVHNVERLFCQNERAITLMRDPKNNRLLAHIAVGATMVGKIDLNYINLARVKKACRYTRQAVEHENMVMEAGQELGKFMFGSTIILLFEQGLMEDFAVKAPLKMKMGEILGTLA